MHPSTPRFYVHHVAFHMFLPTQCIHLHQVSIDTMCFATLSIYLHHLPFDVTCPSTPCTYICHISIFTNISLKIMHLPAIVHQSTPRIFLQDGSIYTVYSTTPFVVISDWYMLSRCLYEDVVQGHQDLGFHGRYIWKSSRLMSSSPSL